MTSPTGWGLAALCGVAAFLPLRASQAQEPRYRFSYAAKVVCGTPGQLVIGAVVVQALPQAYATTLNIYNPNTDSVAVFAKSLLVTLPPGRQQPVKPDRLAVDTLGPRMALATDCTDLRKRRPNLPAFFEGFVVLDSRMSLDVVGVYTVRGGISVVTVPERVRNF